MTAGAVPWASNGLADRTRLILDQILENRSDRGPNPDFADDVDSLRDLIKKTVRASVEIQGGYHEGGGGESKWLIPVLVALTISFILGGVGLTVTVFSLKQEVTDLRGQVEKVERIVEPRYRGAP